MRVYISVDMEGVAGVVHEDQTDPIDPRHAGEYNRFRRLMTALDMQAWTAVRMIGEAVSRKSSADPKVILDFLKGTELALGAFKGQKLTLRDWAGTPHA